MWSDNSQNWAGEILSEEIDVTVDGEGIMMHHDGQVKFFPHCDLDLFLEELHVIANDEKRQVANPDYLPYNPIYGF